MARIKGIRFGGGSLDYTVTGESNADGSVTLNVQAEQVAGTVTIASGQSLSPAIDTGGRRLAAVQLPSAWTAAGLSFQASMDGVTYADLYDDAGNEVTAQAAASRVVVFDALALMLAPFRYVKLRSGTTGSAVPQAADRAIGYATRGG